MLPNAVPVPSPTRTSLQSLSGETSTTGTCSEIPPTAPATGQCAWLISISRLLTTRETTATWPSGIRPLARKLSTLSTSGRCPRS